MTTWRKSSWCANGECLEVGARWAKSSRCDSNLCMEVRRPSEVAVHVRDSADPGGPVLKFGAAEWKAFVAGLR